MFYTMIYYKMLFKAAYQNNKTVALPFKKKIKSSYLKHRLTN